MKINKLSFAAFTAAAMMVTTVFGIDEEKGKVILTVDSVKSGPVEICCDNPGNWKFDAKASLDDGRDVITVTISAPEESEAPKFGVYYHVSGAKVKNVWTADTFNNYSYPLRPSLWWGWLAKCRSQLARNTPISVGIDFDEKVPVALVCSEVKNYLEFGMYADERTCLITARCDFFQQPVAKLKDYSVKVMLDRRGAQFADVVREATSWIMKENGFKAAYTPESAYDPLYSTWYAYLQDVHDKPLEEEARLAAELGMKTMILDDGWQKDKSVGFYSAVGDWKPVKSRFPDMKKHVETVHKAGLKYMPWLAVPFVGDESEAWKRFEKKCIWFGGETSPGRNGVLDPRFPEVREYLISTYERMLTEYGFDGMKLDFIDSFYIPDGSDPGVKATTDPALKDNYAGRDYKSIPEAVNRLMIDIHDRLLKINPEVLIEFRQGYMGPAILQYGNMMRAADCPADMTTNRRRICDLRLTSDKIAVHSDMLVWSADETPEGAALPILNAIYGVIQYSMVLKDINPTHKDVIRHWLKFSQDHREALLKGKFTPHHPEAGYTWVVGESDTERVITVYNDDVIVKLGDDNKKVYVINATGSDSLVVEGRTKRKGVSFDTFGRETKEFGGRPGIRRIKTPKSGYLCFE